MTVTDVAKHFSLDPKTVKEIDKLFLEQDYGQTDYADLRILTIDSWCELAAEIHQPDMKRFIKRLRFFEYGILNHCRYRIGTSKLEGVNNKIKVIKRKAYGFRDNRYFTLKVIQAFHKIRE